MWASGIKSICALLWQLTLVCLIFVLLQELARGGGAMWGIAASTIQPPNTPSFFFPLAFHVIRFNWVGKKKVGVVVELGMPAGIVGKVKCADSSPVCLFASLPHTLWHTTNHSQFSIISMSFCAFEVLNPAQNPTQCGLSVLMRFNQPKKCRTNQVQGIRSWNWIAVASLCMRIEKVLFAKIFNEIN